jgi:phosphonate transport system substrate-binding protein
MPVSIKRVLLALVPLLIAVAGGAYYLMESGDPSKTSGEKRIEDVSLSIFRHAGPKPEDHRLNERFQDADSDLVADAPSDAAELIDPNPLVFSYVAGESAAEDAGLWAGFVEHLSQATGRPVDYLQLSDIEQQLQALKEGKLHVTGLNSGSVPGAVNSCGFVPVCTYGTDEREAGYRMLIIVPESSPVKVPAELKGGTIAFTHMTSHSGFKAPVVVLMQTFNLYPARDYSWAFTTHHQASIRGVAEDRYSAAAVASDLLEAAIASGEIKEGQVRVIYESEKFPPAALGYVYNLNPELAAKVRQAMLDFKFGDTPLAQRFGASGVTQFVPISYKDDWAIIRSTDDALALRTSKD